MIACYIFAGNGLHVDPDDLRRMTHLNIAFGHLTEDGSIRTDFLHLEETVRAYRQAAPQLRILLSIGGAHPAAFSSGAATAPSRRRIAENCAALVARYGLDGIDYDWEYPCCPSNRIAAAPADRQNFTALCAEIRTALDNATEGKALFTIAAGAGDFYLDFTEMERVQAYTDYIFLMTYDLRCGFHSLTGHHTNVYRATGDLFRTSGKDAFEAFVRAGVPAEKLVFGAAFYSRQWHGVPDWNNGFLQYVPSNGGYGPGYGQLASETIGKGRFKRYWDDEAKAPYLYDGSTFISYDDPESIAAKCAYIRQAGGAGIFAWEYNNDRPGTLLRAMECGMRP